MNLVKNKHGRGEEGQQAMNSVCSATLGLVLGAVTCELEWDH